MRLYEIVSLFLSLLTLGLYIWSQSAPVLALFIIASFTYGTFYCVRNYSKNKEKILGHPDAKYDDHKNKYIHRYDGGGDVDGFD